MASDIEENRRQDAASRSLVKEISRVEIFHGGNKLFEGKLKDYGKGGIGIEVYPLFSKAIATGEQVIASYFLCRTKIKFKFFVRSVQGKRVGLEYVDGKKLLPGQRVRAAQNMEAVH